MTEGPPLQDDVDERRAGAVADGQRESGELDEQVGVGVDVVPALVRREP